MFWNCKQSSASHIQQQFAEKNILSLWKNERNSSQGGKEGQTPGQRKHRIGNLEHSTPERNITCKILREILLTTTPSKTFATPTAQNEPRASYINQFPTSTALCHPILEKIAPQFTYLLQTSNHFTPGQFSTHSGSSLTRPIAHSIWHGIERILRQIHEKAVCYSGRCGTRSQSSQVKQQTEQIANIVGTARGLRSRGAGAGREARRGAVSGKVSHYLLNYKT